MLRVTFFLAREISFLHHFNTYACTTSTTWASSGSFFSYRQNAHRFTHLPSRLVPSVENQELVANRARSRRRNTTSRSNECRNPSGQLCLLEAKSSLAGWICSAVWIHHANSCATQIRIIVSPSSCLYPSLHTRRTFLCSSSAEPRNRLPGATLKNHIRDLEFIPCDRRLELFRRPGQISFQKHLHILNTQTAFGAGP